MPAQIGQILQEVIDRLQLPATGVGQQLLHAALGFASEQGHALCLQGPNVGGQVRQHSQAAADVETAHNHRNARRPELPRQVGGARKLVGLRRPATCPACRQPRCG